MPHDPNAQLDQTVLDWIENSPTGSVPHTPTYQDALRRLYATHQVYASADFKDGHVTVRSLAKSPAFYAVNLDELVAGKIEVTQLEPNAAIFDRYLESLPPALRATAETHRQKLVGRRILHRKHHGTEETAVIHDPVHSLFLVPGAGPRQGLPGNYLHGLLFEVLHGDGVATWAVQLHDSEDGAASCEVGTLPEALDKIQEVRESAPFHLSELGALGFKPI